MVVSSLHVRLSGLSVTVAAVVLLASTIPSRAGDGHGKAAQPPGSHDETPAPQCARRDTYNDIYYVPCNSQSTRFPPAN